MARQLQAAPSTPDVDKTNGGGEQPLDLSKGSSNASNSSPEPKQHLSNNVNVRLPTLDTKQIFK